MDVESSTEQSSPGEPRGLKLLLRLQETDVAADRLRTRLNTLEGEGEIREARARLTAAETRLGQARMALDDVEREQRRVEGDVDMLSRKADAERKRLFDGSVANAKELQAIEAEVAGLKARIGRLEDQVLEHMERREELEGIVADASQEAERARAVLLELVGSSASEIDEVRAGLQETARKREELLPSIDDELLGLYEDVRRQRKGVGAAALVDGICQGCHQKLSPVYLAQLRRIDGVKRCEYCRRILIVR